MGYGGLEAGKSHAPSPIKNGLCLTLPIKLPFDGGATFDVSTLRSMLVVFFPLLMRGVRRSLFIISVNLLDHIPYRLLTRLHLLLVVEDGCCNGQSKDG